MPLSDEKRKELHDAAQAAGLDPDEVVAEAEKIAGEDAPPEAKPAGEKAEAAPAPKGEVKIFAYHLPFMKVREVRASIGLADRIDDDEMPTGEWLAKHGGGVPSPGGGAPAE